MNALLMWIAPRMNGLLVLLFLLLIVGAFLAFGWLYQKAEGGEE
jgi:hypothetical protein